MAAIPAAPDPMTAAIMGAAQGLFSDAPMQTWSGGTAPFDASGLSISFGDGSSIATDRTQSAQNDLAQWLPYVGIAAALLIAYRLTRRKKG